MTFQNHPCAVPPQTWPGCRTIVVHVFLSGRKGPAPGPSALPQWVGSIWTWTSCISTCYDYITDVLWCVRVMYVVCSRRYRLKWTTAWVYACVCVLLCLIVCQCKTIPNNTVAWRMCTYIIVYTIKQMYNHMYSYISWYIIHTYEHHKQSLMLIESKYTAAFTAWPPLRLQLSHWMSGHWDYESFLFYQ